MKADELLSHVKIASPCPAQWDSMQGDDRVRFCGQCQKYVYNFSAMTTGQAVDLIRSKEGRLCARFYRREDGTVLTEDCPVGLALYWNGVKRGLGAIAAVIIASLSGFGLGSRAVTSFLRSVPPSNIQSYKMGEMAGKISVSTMGDVAVSPGSIPLGPITPKPLFSPPVNNSFSNETE